MKKLLMGVLLLLPLSAFSQEDAPIYWASKPLQCSTTDGIIELVKKYGEVPTIILNGVTALPNGATSPSKFVIAMNPKTKSWTLLEFTQGDQACILGTGEGDITFGKQGTRT